MSDRRRIYTIADYRRDLARLDSSRHTAAPGLNTLLAARVIADAGLVSPESAPPAPASMVVARRRTTPAGGFLAPAAGAPVVAPVTDAVLRAVGLGPRPSGRSR